VYRAGGASTLPSLSHQSEQDTCICSCISCTQGKTLSAFAKTLTVFQKMLSVFLRIWLSRTREWLSRHWEELSGGSVMAKWKQWRALSPAQTPMHRAFRTCPWNVEAFFEKNYWRIRGDFELRCTIYTTGAVPLCTQS
jgi:hypothetical protein